MPTPILALALLLIPTPRSNAGFTLPTVQDDGKPTAPKGAMDLEELARQSASLQSLLKTLPDKKVSYPTARVNGVTITPEEFLRIALYSSGEGIMMGLRLQVITDREIDKRAKAGEDVSKYRMTDAQLREQLELMQKKVEEARPDLTWDQFLAQSKQTPASFQWSLRQQASFDTVWFPTDTTNWPTESEEAAASIYQGPDPKARAEMVQRIKDAVRASRNPETAGAAAPNQMAVFLVKRQLIAKLLDRAQLMDALDGIDKDLGLQVGDVKFKSVELLEKGMGLGGYMESLRAIELGCIVEAVHQKIVAMEDADWAKAKAEAKNRGDAEVPKRPIYWLEAGSDAYKTAFEAENKKYPTPPFDLKGLVHFRKFPSMQIYRYYFQMFESFRRATVQDRSDKAIAAHVEDAKLFFSNGQVDPEVIWYSYMADSTKGSVEEGFEAARVRAERGIADIRKGAKLAEAARKAAKDAGKTEAEAETAAVKAAAGFTFSDILERDSDYKDQIPSQGSPTPNFVRRGRFGFIQRNLLVEKVNESELLTMLQGFSFGETLFYDVPVGEVIGPLRGVEGYYIARVKSRSAGGKAFELKEGGPKDMASEDLANHQFVKFVNEALASAKIEVVQ